MRKQEKILFVLCFLFVLFISIDASADVFGTLATRATMFARGLRKLAYVIACFGIIMFTWMAIFGKISFRHLGFIFMSLFLLSGMGALIDEYSGGYAALESNFDDTYYLSLSPQQFEMKEHTDWDWSGAEAGFGDTFADGERETFDFEPEKWNDTFDKSMRNSSI